MAKFTFRVKPPLEKVGDLLAAIETVADSDDHVRLRVNRSGKVVKITIISKEFPHDEPGKMPRLRS